jgi:hypothetical protein
MRKELLLSAVILSLLSLAMPTIADDVTVSAEVEKYVEVTPWFDSVSYGALATGSSNIAAPDQGDGLYNFTVDANYGYAVSVSGADFSDGGSESFDIGNLILDTKTTAGALDVDDGHIMTASPFAMNPYTYTDTTNFFGFWLSIPASQYATSYSTNVTLSYANT